MKKILLIILFLCFSTKCFSAQFLYKTVKPSGGDYTTLEACLDDNEQDLTGDGWFDIEIDGDWTGTADTTAVTVNNYTTTSDDYISIYTTGDARHDGKRYGSKASAYHITGSSGNLLNSSVEYVTITGLQFFASWGVGYTVVLNNQNILQESILKSNTGDANCYTTQEKTSYQMNNIYIWTGSYSTGAIKGYLSTMYVYNNVFDGISWGDGPAIGCYDNTYHIVNNLGFRGAAALVFANAGGCSTYTTNGTDDASGSPDALDNMTYADTFENVTGGSEDYHLKSGSAAIDVGTNLSGTFTGDIDGETRSGTWDIGVDETASAPPTGRTRRFF